MTRSVDFIRDGRIPDIEYRTDAPDEIVCPRVTTRGGQAVVYVHRDRHAPNKGFVPVTVFLERLARREPGLAVAGYRSNGRQTTISFNRADRVTLSRALQRHLESLVSRPTFDAEARVFLDGFLAPQNPQFVHWLPRYIQTLSAVRQALDRDAPETIFELIWKQPDNAVSNAGPGILGFAAADQRRDGLIEIIREIHKDGSAANFDVLIERLERWRAAGELPMVPRLLLARAFAAIHPERYHTTVHETKQDHVIPWFVEHTGFVAPNGNWATKASALTTHLERSGVFKGDQQRRNMFPWYVFDQLRDASGRFRFKPGHTQRDEHTQVSERTARVLSLSHRHDIIQNRLYFQLCELHGANRVATEHPTGTGGRADAVVQLGEQRFALYEIKPAASASDAVRQAIGQLLEYGYRRGGLNPVSLTVVSDAALDPVTREYLQQLEARFGLKLNYLQVAADRGGDLVEAEADDSPSLAIA
jgi:hypothetical protein